MSDDTDPLAGLIRTLNHHRLKGAACAGQPTSTFFPVGRPSTQQLDEAKTYCDRCPADTRAACIEIGEHEQHGIWGGWTAADLADGKHRATRPGPRHVQPDSGCNWCGAETPGSNTYCTDLHRTAANRRDAYNRKKETA